MTVMEGNTTAAIKNFAASIGVRLIVSKPKRFKRSGKWFYRNPKTRKIEQWPEGEFISLVSSESEKTNKNRRLTAGKPS
jgi:hypothetical protein